MEIEEWFICSLATNPVKLSWFIVSDPPLSCVLACVEGVNEEGLSGMLLQNGELKKSVILLLDRFGILSTLKVPLVIIPASAVTFCRTLPLVITSVPVSYTHLRAHET